MWQAFLLILIISGWSWITILPSCTVRKTQLVEMAVELILEIELNESSESSGQIDVNIWWWEKLDYKK